MKKVLSLMALALFALTGCDSQAQDSVSINAGNPDSNNVLIMEGYEAVVVPGNAAQPQPAVPNNNSQQQPAATDGNNQNNGGTAVFENVTDTQTPNAEEIDIDAVAVPEN